MHQNGLFHSSTIIRDQDLIEPKFLEGSPSLDIVIISAVHYRRSENGGIRENVQYFLFTDVFSGEILGNSVLLGASAREVDQSK